MSWLFIGCEACNRSLLEIKEIIVFGFWSLITDLKRGVFIMGLNRGDLVLIGNEGNTEWDALFRGCCFWRFWDVVWTLRRLRLVHLEGWLDHFGGVLRRMICLFNSFSINMIWVITHKFRWNLFFFLKDSCCRLTCRIELLHLSIIIRTLLQNRRSWILFLSMTRTRRIRLHSLKWWNSTLNILRGCKFHGRLSFESRWDSSLCWFLNWGLSVL